MRKLLPVAALFLLACGPALNVTRWVPPRVNIGNKVQRVAVDALGDYSVAPVLRAELESSIVNNGTYQLVAMCGLVPCAPYDVMLRATVVQSTFVVDKPGAAPARQTGTATVGIVVDVFRADGVVLNHREYRDSDSGTMSSTNPQVLLRGAIRDVVRAFLWDITPTRVTDRLDLDDEGPLKDGCKLATDGNLDAAREAFSRLLAQGVAVPGAHHNLGVLDEVAGNYDAAFAHYQAASQGSTKQLYLNALGNMQRRLADQQRMQQQF